MGTIYELLARAAALREETALNSISPERAGGIMYDTIMAINELWLQQGSALVISKIYSSVSAMEADDEPVSDITGQPLRAGQIVVIASSDSDNGSVYRFGGISEGASVWALVGLIGNITPVDALDSDSTQLPLAAHQGKVLDGKISQLGQKVDGLVYDVTKENTGSPTFASLSALLSDVNLSTLIPTSVRTGGMSIRFVQTSDHKYVQFRLNTLDFSTNIGDWSNVEMQVDEMISVSYSTTPGTYNASGNIVEHPDEDGKHTNKIRVNKGDKVIFNLKYASGHLRYVGYGAYKLDGTWKERVELVWTGTKTSYTYELVVPEGIGYISWFWYGYNDDTVYIQRLYNFNSNQNRIDEQLEQINNSLNLIDSNIDDLLLLVDIPFTSSAGTYNSAGQIVEHTDEDGKHTSLIRVQNGDIIKFELKFTSKQPKYAGYGTFHPNGNWKQRVELVSSGVGTSYSYTLTVHDNIGYISWFWYGYNDDTVSIRFIQPIKNLKEELIDEINAKVSFDAYKRNRDKELYLSSAVRFNKKAENSKDFGILEITDSHGDTVSESNSILMANGFQYVDTLIHCGDFVLSDVRQYSKTRFDSLVGCNKPFLFVVGNHDVGNSYVKSYCFTNSEAYTNYIKPIVEAGILANGEYESGKCYYFHDFTSYKIRIICVYEYDDPNDTDPNDYTKYRIRRGHSVISQQQAAWFFQTLATTPEGWSVIVAMHNPFSNNASAMSDEMFNENSALSSSYSQRLFSTDIWAEAVNAYKNRVPYTCNMICTGDAEYLNDQSTGIYWTESYDFSNAKGSFLCFIGGHCHKDFIWKHNTYAYQKQVSPVCANSAYEDSKFSDIRRTWLDSLSKDSLTFIGCNLDNSKLGLVKLGVNVTEKAEPRDFEVLELNP